MLRFYRNGAPQSIRRAPNRLDSRVKSHVDTITFSGRSEHENDRFRIYAETLCAFGDGRVLLYARRYGRNACGGAECDIDKLSSGLFTFALRDAIRGAFKDARNDTVVGAKSATAAGAPQKLLKPCTLFQYFMNDDVTQWAERGLDEILPQFRVIMRERDLAIGITDRVVPNFNRRCELILMTT